MRLLIMRRDGRGGPAVRVVVVPKVRFGPHLLERRYGLVFPRRYPRPCRGTCAALQPSPPGTAKPGKKWQAWAVSELGWSVLRPLRPTCCARQPQWPALECQQRTDSEDDGHRHRPKGESAGPVGRRIASSPPGCLVPALRPEVRAGRAAERGNSMPEGTTDQTDSHRSALPPKTPSRSASVSHSTSCSHATGSA